jgi:hypothetical protein
LIQLFSLDGRGQSLPKEGTQWGFCFPVQAGIALYLCVEIDRAAHMSYN